MSEISKQQQAAVAAHQNAQQQQQQSPAQQHSQMQQQVEGQALQVQITHDGSEQIHQQGNQVASSNATITPNSTMVMAASQQALLPQQAMQNLQSPPSLAPMHSQAGSTTITTMSTGPPQQMADWTGHGRVQVIQQPIQNPTYIQPVYNAQGQLIVPGNIAVHPGNMNPPIQVITAGKAFQPGQMPHMLATAQGKPIVQGQTASFPYATIPTSGSNQTLVISQLGVLGQTNILQHQQPQGKPQEMQKMMTKTNVATNSNLKSAQPQQQQNVSIGNLVSSQPQTITTQAQAIIQPQIISPIQYTCNTPQQRAVPQGATQTMQFAPWQATFGPAGLPQGFTWAPGAIQSSALLTQGSQIFIRNPQPEQAGMFIHNAQPSAVNQQNQISGQQINKPAQTNEMNSTVQPKPPIPKAFSTILPSYMAASQQIRTASGVSTQTNQTQTTMHQSNFQGIKPGSKVRSKSVCRLPSISSTQKTDAANQTTKTTSIQLIQPKLLMSGVTPGTACTVTQESKIIKPGSNMQNGAPQPLTQPLAQIQQMQSIFQEPMEQKPQPGQLMMSNGIQNGGDRAVMPVVSMPPNQMTPIMGNMIVQTVPGIAAMAPGISIPAGQTVQVNQEAMGSQNSGSAPATIKQENVDSETRNGVEENGTESGGSRLCDELSSEESNAAAEPVKEEKRKKKENEKTEEKKDVKDVKPTEKELAALGHPKATMMVKPQVLTHVIEGFVIQESSEPFPVNRGCMEGLIRKMPVVENGESGEPSLKRPMLEANGKEREKATCETCGKTDLKSKFKKSKRFCTMSCARRFNVGCSTRIGLFSREGNKVNSEGEPDANESPGENPSPGAEAAEPGQNPTNQENENKVNPLQWTVAEVCEFIRTLPGCADYVEDFALHDIDGEALMLLKPDHLITNMSIKLGPAVKIIAKIDTMRNGETTPAA